MAQHFKYNTGATINNTTQKGNIAIATSGTYDWGPTSTTGFYPETSPSTGGYTIYYMRSTGGPSIEVATSDAQCITFLKSFGATGSTISDVLSWASNTANYYVQTGATPSYTIGQSALGGTIAYILQPGDPGYDAGVTHGLVATTADISTSAPWGCFGTTISGADGTAIGTGNANTIAITAGCATAGIAARLCQNVTDGGYSDWYLPSKDELNTLYTNRVAIGGFANAYYWSSSQYNGDTDLAWRQVFSTFSQTTNLKNISYHIRAVRSF